MQLLSWQSAWGAEHKRASSACQLCHGIHEVASLSGCVTCLRISLFHDSLHDRHHCLRAQEWRSVKQIACELQEQRTQRPRHFHRMQTPLVAGHACRRSPHNLHATAVCRRLGLCTESWAKHKGAHSPVLSAAPSPRGSRPRPRASPSAARIWSQRPAGSLRPGQQVSHRAPGSGCATRAADAGATAHAPATSFASSCWDFAPCARKASKSFRKSANVWSCLQPLVFSCRSPRPVRICCCAAMQVGCAYSRLPCAAPAAGRQVHQWPPPPAAWQVCRCCRPRHGPRSLCGGGSTPAPREASKLPMHCSGAAAACPQRLPVAWPAACRAGQACVSLRLRARWR